MRETLTVLFILYCSFVLAQSETKLVLSGDYSKQDSVEIVQAFVIAQNAIEAMYEAFDEVWTVGSEKNKKERRFANWQQDEHLMKWLGEPDKIRMVRRRIRRIYNKSQKKVLLKVSDYGKGNCQTWVSAYTWPYGKVKIVLCPNYLKYRKHLRSKTIVHELAHEAGMLFDKHIQGCWWARRAAASSSNFAKGRPENYAWLAVSYLGQDCGE